MTLRWILVIGALGGFLSVLLGAFAAHGLRSRLAPEMLAVFQTGVQYQFFHSLALLMTGLLAVQLGESAGLRWSGTLFLAGILLFSGSLYVLALSGVKWLGAVTPFGGTCFLAGWLVLAISLWRHYPAQ